MPNLKAAKDAAVRAKLERGQAYLGYMLNQSMKSGDGSCQAATQETPSQKGSGKGSGAAPGVGAVVRGPPASPSPHRGEGERGHPTHSARRRQRNAGCTGQVKSPLLRGCGGILWLCSLACLLAQIWVDATFFAGCQTVPSDLGAFVILSDTDDLFSSTLHA